LYYTVSGIITPIGGRPMHRLREDFSASRLRNYHNSLHNSQEERSSIFNLYALSSEFLSLGFSQKP